MAFPTTGILDNFNRGDEGPPPSASWITPLTSYYTGMSVSGNQCVSAAAPSAAAWGTQFGPDSEIYFTVASLGADAFIDIFIRLNDLDFGASVDYYYFSIAHSGGTTYDWYVYQVVDGVLTQKDTGSFTLNDGDSVGMSAVGTTIKALHKPSAGAWTELSSITDSGVAGAGYISFAWQGAGTLTIDDFGGGDATAGPTAAFSGTPLSGPAPLSVDFTDASTGSPTTWSWDFGDGDTSTDQNPTHVFTSPGTYTVALTVTNDDGSDTETKVDYITALGPPVADFSGTPTSCTVALSVDFTDLSTNSPDTWFWDFGDGGSSTSQNPTHVYNYIGTYTVTLTATSSAGATAETKIDYITVTAAAEVGPAEIENCDIDTGGAAVGLRVSDVAIARDNILGSVTIDASAELRAKDNAYSTLVNNGTLTSLAGDRAVWETTNFAAAHARDIDEATGTYHLVSAATQTYTISNPGTDRAYDVTALTLNELATVVGTLIADLQAKGLLS